MMDLNPPHGAVMPHIASQPRKNSPMQLADFGELQSRYQAMRLTDRAGAVLEDAAPALKAAEQLLSALAVHPKMRHIFETLRHDQALIGKMRPSEARNMLLDSSCDFIGTTRKKLAAWRKTMERIGAGEGVLSDGGSQEYISSHVPLALAISSISTAGGYLAIVQIALAELSRIDSKNALQHNSTLARIRRCATLLSDCENAAGFTAVVH